MVIVKWPYFVVGDFDGGRKLLLFESVIRTDYNLYTLRPYTKKTKDRIKGQTFLIDQPFCIILRVYY